MDSLDSLFKNEILEDMEDDVMYNEDNGLVEYVMNSNELDMLDEAEENVPDDNDLDDFLDDNDIIDDMMDMEDAIHEI